MKKRKIIIVFLLILLTFCGGIYIYLKVYKKNFISPISSNLPTPSLQLQELVTWVDQSEFSFQYPKGLGFNPHEEDQDNYAHIELTSATNEGRLVIWAKDTTAENIEEWLKQIKAKNVIDSQLGAEPAKKILTANGGKKITVATIRNGYLYQIDVELIDEVFWNKVYETVISSFKFIEPSIKKDNKSSYGTSDVSGSDGEYFDEEELIE